MQQKPLTLTHQYGTCLKVPLGSSSSSGLVVECVLALFFPECTSVSLPPCVSRPPPHHITSCAEDEEDEKQEVRQCVFVTSRGAGFYASERGHVILSSQIQRAVSALGVSLDQGEVCVCVCVSSLWTDGAEPQTPAVLSVCAQAAAEVPPESGRTKSIRNHVAGRKKASAENVQKHAARSVRACCSERPCRRPGGRDTTGRSERSSGNTRRGGWRAQVLC